MSDSIANLPTRLKQVLMRDPKKAGILCVLTVGLLFSVSRMLQDQTHTPATASASTSAQGRAIDGGRSLKTDNLDAEVAGMKKSNTALEQWLSPPLGQVSRNLFTVRLEYFPDDTSGKKGTIRSDTASGFWDQLAKSLSIQADEREKKQTLIANYMAQASRLRPQTILMGASPKALINGSLVGEGELVASDTGDDRIEFRVLKIEARRIIVEREGIKLEIPLN